MTSICISADEKPTFEAGKPNLLTASMHVRCISEADPAVGFFFFFLANAVSDTKLIGSLHHRLVDQM